MTQPAGAPLNGYHDRAPVVLFGTEWARWLDVEADVTDLLGLKAPTDSPEPKATFGKERKIIPLYQFVRVFGAQPIG